MADDRMPLPTAVIIGNHTQGLGIARSAAGAGAQVWVVNDKAISLSRFSRHVSRYKRLRRGTLTCLDRQECAGHLKETLLGLEFKGTAVLFGVNEDITRFIHQHSRDLRSRYLIPDVRLDAIYDKFVFNSLAPESARIDTRLCSEVELASHPEPERFLIKGRCGNAFRQITGEKAICLADFTKVGREQLFAKLSQDQVVVQEIIKTTRPVLSLCSFSVNGQMAGMFGYEKLRQHPNCFGTGTYLRSASVDMVRPAAEAILKGLEFTGISEIEFIYQDSQKAYRVIEMNPRTWKSVHFATQCGENLVGRQLSHFAGRRVDTNGTYAKDRHWADLATDLPQMWREKRINGYDRGFFECTWTRSDPAPALALWTLFPLIAMENWMCSRITARQAGPPRESVASEGLGDLES